MSCLTLVSRSGVPMWPRKYLLTTTLVASCDQKSGTSTSFCSKTLLPDSLEMPARAELPGDLVVGMDARAGVSPLEGQALDPGLAIRLRTVEGGAPGTGVSAGVCRRRVARGLRLGGVAGGLRGLRVGLGCRAGGASGHRFLSSFVGLTADFRPSRVLPLRPSRVRRFVASRAIRGSCRILLSSWIPGCPGGHVRAGGPGPCSGPGRVGGSVRWSVSERSGDPKNVTPMGESSQARKHKM